MSQLVVRPGWEPQRKALPAVTVLCQPFCLPCAEGPDDSTVVRVVDQQRLKHNFPKVPSIPPPWPEYNLAGSDAISPAASGAMSNPCLVDCIQHCRKQYLQDESTNLISSNKSAISYSRELLGCSKLIFKSPMTSGTQSPKHASHAVRGTSTPVVSLGGCRSPSHRIICTL